MFDLNGKVALVTGSSSGLGVQFARALAKQEADVVLVARRLDRLNDLKGEIESIGRRCLALQCDVTKEEEVSNVFKTTVDTFGKIDILVNNAGVAAGGSAESLSQDDWDKVIDTDLKGVFLCSKYAGQYMIQRNYGKIINISSMFGVVGNNGIPASAYHAAKGGVVNYTKALASEWAKYNITVNAIGPGFFDSEMTQGVKNIESVNNFIINSAPMKRWGKEGELDGAIIYFSSDASSFTTGQMLCVDGGWTAI